MQGVEEAEVKPRLLLYAEEEEEEAVQEAPGRMGSLPTEPGLPPPPSSKSSEGKSPHRGISNPSAALHLAGCG